MFTRFTNSFDADIIAIYIYIFINVPSVKRDLRSLVHLTSIHLFIDHILNKEPIDSVNLIIEQDVLNDITDSVTELILLDGKDYSFHS